MNGVNWTKLATLVIVAVGTIILGFYGKLPGEAVSSLLAACLGYVFGNSHGLAEVKRLVPSKEETGNGN